MMFTLDLRRTISISEYKWNNYANNLLSLFRDKNLKNFNSYNFIFSKKVVQVWGPWCSQISKDIGEMEEEQSSMVLSWRWKYKAQSWTSPPPACQWQSSWWFQSPRLWHQWRKLCCSIQDQVGSGWELRNLLPQEIFKGPDRELAYIPLFPMNFTTCHEIPLIGYKWNFFL